MVRQCRALAVFCLVSMELQFFDRKFEVICYAVVDNLNSIYLFDNFTVHVNACRALDPLDSAS